MVCLTVTRARGRYCLFPPAPHQLLQVVKVGLGVVGVGLLILPASYQYSTWENGNSTSPGQHTSADAVGGGANEVGM